MSVESLQTLSNVCIVVAVVALFVAILMFFGFNIPRLIDELTGRDAKRFIAEAKKKNEEIADDTPSETSGTLLSSELVSEQLGRSVTTKLRPNDDTTLLNANPSAQNQEQPQQDSSQAIPVIDPDAEFRIIEEIRFTSSTEIIE